jgi:CRP-like cAMP-binding protein
MPAYSGKNRLLAAIPSEDFARFFSDLEPVLWPIKHVIREASRPVTHVYFIESGVASILTIMADGSSIEVGMTGPEGMVGIVSLLDPEAVASRVIVQVPGKAVRMPVARCKAVFDENAAVRAVMLRFAGSLIALSAQTAACNRLHSIEQRFARWLLMAHDRVKTDTIPMTHEFLASMLGVRRAGVTTIAGELQRSG